MSKRFKTIGEPLSPKALAEKNRLEELAHVATGGIFRRPPQHAPGSVLENSYVRVEFERKGGRREPAIHGGDKTDTNNEPRFFTQNKRKLEDQWTALSDRFNAETKYRDVLNILRDHGAKVHDYCAMD